MTRRSGDSAADHLVRGLASSTRHNVVARGVADTAELELEEVGST